MNRIASLFIVVLILTLLDYQNEKEVIDQPNGLARHIEEIFYHESSAGVMINKGTPNCKMSYITDGSVTKCNETFCQNVTINKFVTYEIECEQEYEYLRFRSRTMRTILDININPGMAEVYKANLIFNEEKFDNRVSKAKTLEDVMDYFTTKFELIQVDNMHDGIYRVTLIKHYEDPKYKNTIESKKKWWDDFVVLFFRTLTYHLLIETTVGFLIPNLITFTGSSLRNIKIMVQNVFRSSSDKKKQ